MSQQALRDQKPAADPARVPPAARDNLAERLIAAARRQGSRDRCAVRIGARRWTHGQVHAGAAATATLLARSGVAPGDRVLIAAPDGIEFLWAFLGAVRLGAIAVPLDPAATPADHAHAAAETTPAAVVCPQDLADRFPSATTLATEELPGQLTGLPPRAAAQVTRDTPAYAQFTIPPGGQRPLAALHRHGDPEVCFAGFARRALAIRPNDVLFSVAKLHTAYGLGNSLLFPLQVGACAVLHPGRVAPEEIGALLRRHRPTILAATPTDYAELDEALRAGTPRSLRVAASSGEQLTPAAAQRLRDQLGCPVLDGLIATAAGHVFVANTPGAWRDGTAGRPLPAYQVRVTTEDGRPCAEGEQGELWVRGPTIMLGYHNHPEQTAQVLRDGWLRTGDLASQDADGFVRVAGRADDLQNAGGRLVWPGEVEQLLASHPSVAEVAVAAVRDERGGSFLRAAVVPAAEASAGGLSAELLALAGGQFAARKVPKEVVLVEELPRTASGEPRRHALGRLQAGSRSDQGE